MRAPLYLETPCQALQVVFVLTMPKHQVLHKRYCAVIGFTADLLVSRWSSLNCLKLSFLMFWYLNKYTTGYLHVRIQVDQLSMYTAAFMLRLMLDDLQCCDTYWSHSFLTVVIAPSFHSLVFFFVLVRGTACAGGM